MPDTLATLASVTIGWLLNELSQRFRSSAARRAALGRTLAELLEIHHYLRGLDLVTGELRKRVPLSQTDIDTFLTLLQHILPGDATLVDRYNNAVTEIAATHPFLAFRLRSKEKIPGLLANLRIVQLPDGSSMRVPEDLERILHEGGVEALEDALRDVSWAHGISSRVRVWRYLHRAPLVPPELQAWLDRAASLVPGD